MAQAEDIWDTAVHYPACTMKLQEVQANHIIWMVHAQEQDEVLILLISVNWQRMVHHSDT
jgi:hypothetical protein